MRTQLQALKFLTNSYRSQKTYLSLPNNFSSCNQIQFRSLYSLNKFHFSSNQQSKETVADTNNANAQAEKKGYEKPKSMFQENLEKRYSKEKIAEVQAQLTNQKLNLYEYLLKVNNQSSNNFEYVSDTLISNNINHKYLKDSPKQILFLTTVWTTVGYLTTFIHPFLTVVPGIFGLGGLISYFAGRRLVQNTIEKITFVPNEIEKVQIYLLKKEEPIICRIDHIEVADISENVEHPYVSDKVFRDSNSKIILQKDISLTLNVQDLAGQPFSALNLIIFGNKDLTTVPSYNLLQTVLEGDVIRLNKFKVNKVHTVSDDFIENMIADKSTEKYLEQKQKQDSKANEIEQEIQEEISRFSKKKN